MSCPLYETMRKHLPDEDLTDEQKRDCIQMIGKLDSEGTSMVFLLIRVHSVKEKGDEKLFEAPYNGEEMKRTNEISDFKFSLEEMPVVLRQMIYKFCKVHMKTMSEEKARENTL